MLLITLVNSAVVALVVSIHYEFLHLMTNWMPRMGVRHRFRILIGVFGALVAHAVEVWVFAAAYYFMHHDPNWGELSGRFFGTLADCAYFSFTTFTTLGFGDIEPSGAIRYLVGIESLTGLVLITWTASFLLLEMQRYWRSD